MYDPADSPSDDHLPVTAIRYLGPAMASAFEEIGITQAGQLREMGADAAYGALLEAGSRPNFIAYFALVMGLQGRPWNDLNDAEKTTLRARFDSLKADAKQARTQPKADDLPPDLAQMLDDIGVRPKV